MYHSCSPLLERVEPGPFGSWYQNVVDHTPDEPFQRFKALNSSSKVGLAVAPISFGSTDTNHLQSEPDIAQLSGFDAWALLPRPTIRTCLKNGAIAALAHGSCCGAVHESVGSFWRKGGASRRRPARRQEGRRQPVMKAPLTCRLEGSTWSSWNSCHCPEALVRPLALNQIWVPPSPFEPSQRRPSATGS